MHYFLSVVGLPYEVLQPTLTLCGHCAGRSAAQSVCSPPCIITAVSVPAGKFVCYSPV